jgi:hypothetical protein
MRNARRLIAARAIGLPDRIQWMDAPSCRGLPWPVSKCSGRNGGVPKGLRLLKLSAEFALLLERVKHFFRLFWSAPATNILGR